MGFEFTHVRINGGKQMKYDVIVVGGGIAGLTTATYLAKEGHKVLICEKGDELGGLVSSFDYKGFTFDGGIRSIESSGIVIPMLRQLEIDIPFKRSIVSLGIEDDIIKVVDKNSLFEYQNLLIKKFPDNEIDIKNIMKRIRKIMKYMDVLYGIDNPLFMDMFKNKKYLFFEVFPWLFKFLFTAGKIDRLNTPIETYLAQLTDNQALNDIIAQHFFKQTPAFFALSYFSLYLDYRYPEKGTGMLIEKLEEYYVNHGGEVKLSTEIVSVDSESKTLKDRQGNIYTYDQMVWASDLNTLYQLAELDKISDPKIKEEATLYKESIAPLRGGDSIQAVYATVDLEPAYFRNLCTEHFFYTPKTTGLFQVFASRDSVLERKNKEEMISWVKSYLDYTTYEISIPALRNEKLAPKGKTGLIISTLMDYDFVKAVESMGWYPEYKKLTEDYIIKVLDESRYNGLKEKIIDVFSYTPLTIEKRTGNRDGAITGWAFTNKNIPVIHHTAKVAQSVLTKFPDIYQAGQWSYSPAGLPISIMTGKLAADKVNKQRKI